MLEDANLASAMSRVPVYAGKTLAERTTGRFYTPDVLAADLAERVSECLSLSAARGEIGGEVKICDPFSGDGRLVVALMTEIASSASLKRKRIVVTLRDIDAAATKVAADHVRKAASALTLNVTVRVRVGDSFADASPETNDAVITNPPWELLKPDARETATMNALEAAAYREWLRSRCAELDRRFPDAKANVSWAGWGTNLARCGWDLALRSCRAGGVLGIVLPSTILADQASVSMRRSVLQQSQLVDLAAYPSEARLFDRVDQPVVAATFVTRPQGKLKATLRLFDAERRQKASRRLQMSIEDLEAADYALPVGFGADTPGLLSAFSGMPRFRDLEGDGPASLWAGRELDETALPSKLRTSGTHPFIKGRMIMRHGLVEDPSLSVAPELARVFRSPSYERLVWRDVSRPSQRRRMIGTIIPSKWVAGNSLHVAHFRDGNAERLRALYAVVSSLVFEFQVRCRLATGHMSLGIVRMSKVPPLKSNTVRTLAASARRTLDNPASDASLEVKVAQIYGIRRDDFAAILRQFPKLEAADHDRLLAKALWSGRTG
jgi:Alw26I/Eco31I/Esp3I family type II restriction m6 adenine DNA methyltransferase